MVPGFGGSLSPDGRFLLTGPDRSRAPRLYDARSGERLDAWEPIWRVLAAVFTGPDRVAWLVEDLRGDGLRLITCGPRVGDACESSMRLGEPDRVLLAGDSRR